MNKIFKTKKSYGMCINSGYREYLFFTFHSISPFFLNVCPFYSTDSFTVLREPYRTTHFICILCKLPTNEGSPFIGSKK